eukprot:3928011-Rhodomonas_salina.1
MGRGRGRGRGRERERRERGPNGLADILIESAVHATLLSPRVLRACRELDLVCETMSLCCPDHLDGLKEEKLSLIHI